MAKPLSEYNRKRNFKITSEPSGETSPEKQKRGAHALGFVIQKHDARRLHYDFRLELDGTLKSWAIPKGPSLDPKDKRLAVHVEDHPISYSSFEGSIPHGQYGGGDVIVWDRGIWQPKGDPRADYRAGKLKFTLVGEKLTGDWTLVRTHLRGSGDKEQWLLIKERDEIARPAEEYDIVEAMPQSVISGAVLNTKKSKANSVKAEKSITEKAIVKKAEKNDVKKTEKQQAKKTAATKNVTRSKSANTLPDFIAPELATLVTEPPPGEWLYEIKFDGYRILARIENGEVSLFTRNANDWTDKLPLQADAILALGLDNTWLDGEVVVLDEKGLPDFQALQNAFDSGRSHNILYYVFDAPFLNGEDLRQLPVEERRAALEKVIPKSKKSLVRFSGAFVAEHQNIVASACAMSLEGVIGKRLGSTYTSRRSNDWIKLKCRLRQEFVIVGYTSPQGSRSGFGALLLAVHEQFGKPALRYAGRVGTGFNANRLQEIYEKLKKLECKESPLAHKLASAQARGVHWVEPTLVCEVEFAQWTGEGILRQAAFISLRSDKPARDIIREQPKRPDEVTPGEASPDALTSYTRTKKTAVNKTSSKKESSRKETSNKGDEKKATLKKATTEKAATKKETIKDTAKKEAAKKSVTKKSASDKSGNIITITHPERVIDPESGGTKKQLADFYAEISPWILPHLDNRAVSILRAPEGITGEQFFQKHTQHMSIPGIKHLDPSLDPGHAALMEIDGVQALVGAVQMGTIEFHTWGSRTDAIELPDRITLDLDPDPALPWRSVVEATQLTLAALDELKLDAYLKTTGGKGMHVVVPIKPEADWEYIKTFSKAISQFMAHQIPDRFVAKMGPQNRIGKIFIDYLRNQRGASAVAAYSVRARPGLPVSVPIERDELRKLTHSSQWNIANLHERLDRLKSDPWEGYKNRQRITQAMWKKIGAKAP